MTKQKSILHPRLGGLVYITGLHGLGKTTLATTAEAPSLTAILDLDLKFEEIAHELGYGWYQGPYDVPGDPFGYDIAALGKWFSSAIVSIPDGLTTLVIDNATEIETALGSIVAKNPAKYGVNPANARAGRYGGVNPGIGKLWQSILSYLKSKGVRVVIVVSHMSQPWVDGKPVPNRFKGKGNKVLQQYSNLSLVMVNGDNPPLPSAIVLKEQLARRSFDPETGEYTIIRTLPLRLPKATWPAIKNYLDNPPSFAHPKQGEIPSKREMSTYGDFMSREHLDFILSVTAYSDDNPDTEQQPAHKVEQSPAPAPVQSSSVPVNKGKNAKISASRFMAVCVEQGWDMGKDGEARKLLLEKFGEGYKPERGQEYIEYLRSFYSQKDDAPTE